MTARTLFSPQRRTAFCLSRARSASAVRWLALALVSCCGCEREPSSATVEGTLRLGGQPLESCLITFWPEAGQHGGVWTGCTDSRGGYRLRGSDQREGASVGWHRVTIEDLAVSAGRDRRDHGSVDAGPDEDRPRQPVRRARIPARFASPIETPLRKEVKPGPQVIDLDIRG